MKNLLGNPSANDQTKLNNWALLLLRIGAGLSMVYGHGWSKLMKLLSGDAINFANPLGLGEEFSFYLVVLAEFFCATLVVLGLFTRWATIPLMITMFVIIFLVKWSNPFGDMELAVIYLLSFTVIFLMGPGKYSLDNQLKKA